MNVGELKELLERIDADDDLKIAVSWSGGMRGPAMPVKQAYPGFDWESGQLVMVPEETLTIYKWLKDHRDMIRDAQAKRAPRWLDEIRDTHPKMACYTDGKVTCEVCKMLKYIDALRAKRDKK